MSLEQLKFSLSNFDGVSLSILSETQVKFRKEERYIYNLIDLSTDREDRISDGATWILKAEIENGTQLANDLKEKLLRCLRDIVSWQAVLHICQILHQLNLSENQMEMAIGWAKAYTQHKRPFIRAWSMHAIVVMGRIHHKFCDDVEFYLRGAEQDHAASVRARARQLRKSTS